MALAPAPLPQDYQIAIICALEVESNAVQGSFDELYDANTIPWRRSPHDNNIYTVGRIGQHHVVLAHMSGTGKVNAANTARDIRTTFPNISHGLAFVVGVCGGAPRKPDGSNIYLGDIIVSTEIQQADFGREHPYGFVVKEHSEGNLGSAPAHVKAFLHQVALQTSLSKLRIKTSDYASSLLEFTDIEPPSISSDQLFPADYLHKHHASATHGPARQQCQSCGIDEKFVCHSSQNATCAQLGCKSDNTRYRPIDMLVSKPYIYFGPICSTDTVKRNGSSRDSYTEKHKALGFEMESAGVWNTLPTIVVKAVCDYADSHKSKRWQECAAINAAACCKALIEKWMPRAIVPIMQAAALDPATEHKTLQASYLSSLRFAEIDARFHDIKFAQPGTCEWILETLEFKSWLDPNATNQHHGVLWIKGKPGSGKSTLMKHVHQSNCLRGYTPATYFFHARGSKLQQSLNGMFRSFLYLLLSKDKQLLDRFISDYPQEPDQEVKNRSWSNTELQSFLFRCVKHCWLKNVLLMIDALDECDQTDARELVSFCEDLAFEAIHSKTRLLICFSIRHFPNISMRNCVQISIDDRTEHAEDIKKYALRKIAAEELVPHVLQKSQHVFLWVVLVIQILNRYHDAGASLHTMQQELERIPTGLRAVFNRLLQSEQASYETILLLQLVLHAPAPLTSRTLFQLVAAGSRPQKKEFVQDLDLDLRSVQLFINTGSRGLLECIRSRETVKYSETRGLRMIRHEHEASTSVIQFIHESVTDFLRDCEWFSDFSEPHAAIAEVCLQVLEAGEHDLTQAAYFYAENNVLFHIAEIPDSNLLAELLVRFADWCFNTNSLRTSSRGNLFEEQTKELLVSIIDYTSLGSRTKHLRLLKAAVESYGSFGVFGSDVALLTEVTMYAIDAEWKEAVELLINSGANLARANLLKGESPLHNILANLLRRITVRYAQCSPQYHWDVYENYRKQYFNAIGDIAVLVIKALPHGDAAIIGQSGSDVVPIVIAARIGHLNMVRCLVEVGADPNMVDKQNESALSVARGSGHSDLVELLISYGYEI